MTQRTIADVRIAPEHDTAEPIKTIREPLSWELLRRHEPQLVNIEHRIEAIKTRNAELRGTCSLERGQAYDLWYGFRGHRGIKAQLSEVIGWRSSTKRPELRTSEAYDLCYRHLFDLLMD